MDNPAPVVAPVMPPVTKNLWKNKLPTWEWLVVLTLYIALLGAGVDYWWVQQMSQAVVTPALNLVSAPAVTAMFLDVTSPNPTNEVIGQTVAIIGRTLPNVPVVFYTETQTGEADADSQGNFSGTLPLDTGINSLVVTAVADNGQEKSLALDIVVDNQVLGVSTEKKATAPGQIKKLEQTELAPLVDAKTIIVNSKNKPLKLSVIKPGDKALAILNDATGSGKKAVKIFVQSASESATLASKRQAIQGVVLGIVGQTITLGHQTDNSRQFVITVGPTTVFKIKGVTSPTLAQINVGDRIIAVADHASNDVWLAKMVFVIPGKALGIVRPSAVTPSATPTELATPSATPTELATPSATPGLPTDTPPASPTP